MKIKNSFDLEQQILRCWNITDDIDLLRNSLDSLSKEDLNVFLHGLRLKYHLMFDELFKIFEESIRDSANN